MSFAGGAECSAGANPLAQFQKQVQGGSSNLAQDRLVNRPGGSGFGFNSLPSDGAAQDAAIQQAMAAQDAMLDPAAGLVPAAVSVGMRPPWQAALPHHAMGASMPVPHAVMESAFQASVQPPYDSRMDSLFTPSDVASFRNISTQNSHSGAVMLSPSKMQEMQLLQQQQQQSRAATTAFPRHIDPLRSYWHPSSMVAGNQAPLVWQSPTKTYPAIYKQQESNMASTTVDKGKGKEWSQLDDSQWEEHFKQMSLEEQSASPVDDQESKAMEPELNKLDEQLASHDSETNYGDFDSIWKMLKKQSPVQEEAEDFVLCPDNLGNTVVDQTLWEAPARSSPPVFNRWKNFEGPMREEYLFEDGNTFKKLGNPYETGLQILAEGGNLSLAALAFEAAVQNDPDHVDAWVHLGSVQAQNEKETAAIRALEQAVRLDPTNRAALMGLAVSYINEGYESTAYRTLERWLSVKYPQVISPADLSPPAEYGFTDRQGLHDKVKSLFIEAARLGPGGGAGNMDPDVQVGLGVLLYGSEEYDKAVDCFQAALDSSEQGTVNESSQVHLLWNRLGATLANSGRSEKAIEAYENALSINPNFVRARYNLGVSCINMHCYEQAAGHLLSALAMHKTVAKEGRARAREILEDANGGKPVDDDQLDRIYLHNISSTLYDTLRRVFNQLNRQDLASKVVPGVDPEVFRADFDF